MNFIRPMDNLTCLKVSHNWGDMIPYPILTIIRTYGFQGTPHVFPYHVPLKIGIAEILWQLGGLEETYLIKRGRGSFFPTCIVAHHFVITKGGWLFLYKLLDLYKMVVSHPHFCDTEGFYDLFFRFRDKFGSIKNEPYFPKDIIRNEFSLQEQETKKEKWRVFFKSFGIYSFF